MKPITTIKRKVRTGILVLKSMSEEIYARLIGGKDRKYCPVCENAVTVFFPMGERLRPNARCPRCGSLERHRLIYLYFKARTNIFRDTITLLHFAPEAFFAEKFLKQPNIHYFPVDIDTSMPFVREKADIQ